MKGPPFEAPRSAPTGSLAAWQEQHRAKPRTAGQTLTRALSALRLPFRRGR